MRSKEQFPLLELPLEIRRMIYWEMLKPSAHDQSDGSKRVLSIDTHQIEHEEYALEVNDAKLRADIFATSKQLNTEASEVWYFNNIFKVTVGSTLSFGGKHEDNFSIAPNLRVTPELPSLMLMPTYLPKIRKLEMRGLTRLCYELAAHCHRLQDIILDVPCGCHFTSGQYQLLPCPSMPDDVRLRFLAESVRACLTGEEFLQLTMPLRRLRISQNIYLKSSCNKRGVYHPIFDQLAEIVRSPEAPNELRGNERVWWQAKKEAGPFLGTNVELRERLLELHTFADFGVIWKDNHPVDNDQAIWQSFFDTKVQEIEELVDSLKSSREWAMGSSYYQNEIANHAFALILAAFKNSSRSKLPHKCNPIIFANA
ncbi:MAG: hypothetical protein Q9170_004912 [Blastenia crenularia]